MITFSTDPQTAEQQMRAVIFYLTAFGYVDGELDAAEKRYVRDYAGKLVIDRARAALGDKLDAHYDMIERWIQHFHEMVEETDHQIQELFTESVADGESTAQFVVAKLKLRCFELFRRFDDHTRSEMLASVDELMFADGVVHPSEEAFRRELYQLLLEPVEIDADDLEPIEAGSLIIGAQATLTPTQADHPFFQGSERPYATDKAAFAQEAQGDMELIDRVLATLEIKRAEGKGRLAAASDIGGFPDGARFLDGHVFVNKPAPDARHELLVIGDLHGCYSCLKAALLQADFFGKVEAHKANPAKHPHMGVVLLGDYIDRGRFSYNGVLRAVMQLFTALPD
ncbi:MAG: serine/threonine protein phosphatase, partial [Minicystis sp.]